MKHETNKKQVDMNTKNFSGDDLAAIELAMAALHNTGLAAIAQEDALDCYNSQELEELYDLVNTAYSGTVPASPQYPVPDLSFLPKAQHSPWHINKLGHLLISFSQSLIDSLQVSSFAGATRGELLFRYVQDRASTNNLEVIIDVYSDTASKQLALLRVGVDIPSRDAFDQSGSQVIVRAGETVWQGETDETGWVDLNAIPLSILHSMQVEIRPAA
jgi:hypothetical protein